MNVIITGAGKGIGFEMVKIFTHDKSIIVYAISRNIENLTKLCEAGLKNIIPISFDLNNIDNYNELINNNIQNKGEIDILINNAGLLTNKPFTEFNEDEVTRQFKINFTAPSLLIQALLPYFNKQIAHVVNIGSMGGFQGSSKYQGLSFYSASKGALAIMTECLANELSDKNIKCNCLALGATQTEMLEKAFPGYKAPVSAKEMAKFIVNFAMNAHKTINGKIIPVSVSNP